jgi:hypothetical protein
MKLHIPSSDLTQLSPLHPELTKLWCFDNLLTELPPLPPKLITLVCHNNLLAHLPPLPPTLEFLNCTYNPMSQLPQLPPSLKDIYVSPWQIESCLNKLSNPKTKIIIDNYYEGL